MEDFSHWDVDQVRTPQQDLLSVEVPSPPIRATFAGHPAVVFERVLLTDLSGEGRLLRFALKIDGLEFVDYGEFHEIFLDSPETHAKHFANPLELAGHRLARLAFVARSEIEDELSGRFALRIADVKAGQALTVDHPGEHILVDKRLGPRRGIAFNKLVRGTRKIAMGVLIAFLGGMLLHWCFGGSTREPTPAADVSVENTQIGFLRYFEEVDLVVGSDLTGDPMGPPGGFDLVRGANGTRSSGCRTCWEAEALLAPGEIASMRVFLQAPEEGATGVTVAVSGWIDADRKGATLAAFVWSDRSRVSAGTFRVIVEDEGALLDLVALGAYLYDGAGNLLASVGDEGFEAGDLLLPSGMAIGDLQPREIRGVVLNVSARGRQDD